MPHLNRTLRIINIAAVFLLAIGPQTGLAFACTPPPGGLPAYTAAQRTQAADVVLEGVVKSLQGEFYDATAIIQVVQYLKGSGPAQVTIAGFGPSSLCRSEVFVGQRLIFYAAGDPAAGLQAFYLSQFDAVAIADQPTIDEIIAASGQTPVVMPTNAADATPTPQPPTITPIPLDTATFTPSPPTLTPASSPAAFVFTPTAIIGAVVVAVGLLGLIGWGAAVVVVARKQR